MKIYALDRDDGGVSIMRILDETKHTVEEEIIKLICKGAKITGYIEIKEDDIPIDRTDRKTWAIINGRISVKGKVSAVN